MTLLDYHGAAKILGRSEKTLRKDVMNRKIPHLKPFGRKGKVLFSEEELLKFVRESRVDVEPGKGRGQRRVEVRLSPVTLLQLEKTAADKKLTVNELVERGLQMLVESTAGAAG